MSLRCGGLRGPPSATADGDDDSDDDADDDSVDADGINADAADNDDGGDDDEDDGATLATTTVRP